MFFTVIEKNEKISYNNPLKAYLLVDYWDDWAKYRTMFTLIVIDENGDKHTIGSVKIGQKGLLPAQKKSDNHRCPMLDKHFDILNGDYFSLGQCEDYYESLNKLSESLRTRVFSGLRDCAANLTIFEKYINETVMVESLLRDIRKENVRGKLNRLSRGDAQLTEYAFTYTFPDFNEEKQPKILFEVIPESKPPTNVHVLIGRNGVGKTRAMKNIALSILGRKTEENTSPGLIEMNHSSAIGEIAFSGLILVSFSAFDDFELKASEKDNFIFHQVGLTSIISTESLSPSKKDNSISSDFAKCLQRCKSGVKAQRWIRAMKTLEEDDLFAEANVTSLLEDAESPAQWRVRARKLFKKLSSGHSIVLLTITRLVDLVDEGTLVLIDEPEGHLHPPLLSSFVRTLSDLLISRNGVGIIATHSPVVLQEVPRSCAWKLRRSHAVTVVERPLLETFGENIGILTREVFGLQVTQSGFHRILREEVNDGKSYRQIIRDFDKQLGEEAKAIIQALIIQRDGEL